jgi:hypothetical protein
VTGAEAGAGGATTATDWGAGAEAGAGGATTATDWGAGADALPVPSEPLADCDASPPPAGGETGASPLPTGCEAGAGAPVAAEPPAPAGAVPDVCAAGKVRPIPSAAGIAAGRATAGRSPTLSVRREANRVVDGPVAATGADAGAAAGAAVAPELPSLAACAGASPSTGARNSIAQVRTSIEPVSARPLRCWKSHTASRVSGP